MDAHGSAPLIEYSDGNYTQDYASQLFQQPKINLNTLDKAWCDYETEQGK